MYIHRFCEHAYLEMEPIPHLLEVAHALGAAGDLHLRLGVRQPQVRQQVGRQSL